MPAGLHLCAEYAEGFAAIYPRLAEELYLDYVPFFLEGVGGVAELNLADGLHPTPVGHERLAENVLPVLRETLGSASARSFGAGEPGLPYDMNSRVLAH